LEAIMSDIGTGYPAQHPGTPPVSYDEFDLDIRLTTAPPQA
jgi:hypothetical protein